MKFKLPLVLILTAMLGACGEDEKKPREDEKKPPPVAERVKKVYTAQSVTENGTIVYSSGSTGIKPGYSSYRLDLTAGSTFSLRDVDGTTFTGSYSVTNTSLSLSGITPQPTGTSGTLNFSITSISDDGKSMTLTANQTYAKTGNTTNVYTLTGI